MKCPQCGLMQKSQPRCKRCGSAVASRNATAAPLASDNPYAPPIGARASRIPSDAAGDIFRDGGFLVARDGTPFPDRCVRCNHAAEGFRLKKTFYWHPPNWYALVLLNLLIYAIVAMVVRKKASFEVALCPRHRSRRRWCITAGIGPSDRDVPADRGHRWKPGRLLGVPLLASRRSGRRHRRRPDPHADEDRRGIRVPQRSSSSVPREPSCPSLTPGAAAVLLGWRRQNRRSE